MLFWLLVIGYRKLGIGYRTLRYPIGACAVQYPLSVLLFLNESQNIVNLAEGIFHRVVAVDSKVVMTVEIVCANWFGLCLIYLQTFLDSLVVVICTTTCLTAVEEAFDHLIFLYEHIQQNGLHVATLQEQFQCLSLCYGTWETVKDNAFAICWQVVQIALDEVNHLVIWNQVSAGDQFANLFAELAARFDFGTQCVTC